MHLDSPDHKSHVSYHTYRRQVLRRVPGRDPERLVRLDYPTHGSADGYTLSSGMASSIHGDFMNAWKPENLGALVKVCINAKAKCGTTPGWKK